MKISRTGLMKYILLTFFILNFCIQIRYSYERSLLAAENIKEITPLTSPPDEDRHSEGIVENRMKILCWVMTTPNFHDTRAIHVKRTWGKRCDKLMFVSSQNDSSLPSVALGGRDSYYFIWGKTKRAFKHLYEHYLNEFDWFMKADDDTYVVVENLRHLLSDFNPYDDAIYFGRRYKEPKEKFSYMDGGAGYVLSRRALKLLVEEALPNATLCRQDDFTSAEDIELGRCLANVGVTPGDTRDSEKRERFFHFDPGSNLIGEIPAAHQEASYYPVALNSNCCSDLAISFHWIDATTMYELEYFFYHAHPYSLHRSNQFPPGVNRASKSVLMNKVL